MVYADFEYYRHIYGGTMELADFARLCRPASAYLDRVTFERITDEWAAKECVKDACCAVIDAHLLNERGGGIASETNDGISVTYVSGVSKAKTDNQRLREAALLFLGGTGLMYRGVD